MSAGSPLDLLSLSLRPLTAALASLALAIGLAGCTSAPPNTVGVSPGAPSAQTAAAAAHPRDWVGRWHGPGAAALQIMPATDSPGYTLTIRSAAGITSHYHATTVDDRLIFERGGQTLAIRSGRGAETDSSALTAQSDCLIVVPGRQGYCRHGNTADALPLAHGAFVAVKTDCNAASPSDTLYFDGQALSRPGQNACQAAVVGQQGVMFHLHDSCAADNTLQGANETVSVPDRHHLAVRSQTRPTKLYRYCATGLLPPSLQPTAAPRSY
ncbi:hypothetical protein V5738_15330 [Salinisphaera sp. SPP-AMP-43]|uniref:hypothetical protein n=1 Tax=Salinisphaera sp. SPP-AMP-43 TaxID=3121288 RepID=UPI003C6E7641